MPVSLKMEPKRPPLSWEEFCRISEPFSISIDGAVNAGPKFDESGPRQNFDHHSGVSRHETRATCAQVLLAIREGLFLRFRNEEGPHAIVWADDCDEDVCLAWTLLSHGSLFGQVINPLMNRLVFIEDMLDSTAGTFAYPQDLPILSSMAWVFEPYRRIRMSGELDRKEASIYAGVVTDVEHRILQHVMGSGKSLPLDIRYERIGGGRGWTMVKEIGGQARIGMMADQINAFVSVRIRPDGRYTYVVGRRSVYVPFSLGAIFAQLNAAESCGEDKWGGAETIGGSPRVKGSILSPEQVEKIINDLVGK